MTPEQKIDELEQAITANDERMREVEAENADLKKAIREALSFRPCATNTLSEHIFDYDHYLARYKDASREKLILEIMRLKSELSIQRRL